MKTTIKLTLGAALVAGSLAGVAKAETSNATIDVYAGLSSVMELTCSDVNFGVWRVPTGTRSGGATTVSLTSSDTTSITSGGTDKIALSTKYEAPKSGKCIVSGSTAADSAKGAASITAGDTGSFVTNGGTGFNNETLAAPTAVVSGFTYSLAVTEGSPTINSGAASFGITGTMVIPDSLTNDNYGGYQASSVTVTFNDTQE